MIIFNVISNNSIVWRCRHYPYSILSFEFDSNRVGIIFELVLDLQPHLIDLIHG